MCSKTILSSLAMAFFFFVGPVQAQQNVYGPIVADPSDVQWLYSYVRSTGYVATSDTFRFAKGTFQTRYPTGELYPIACLDVTIEADLEDNVPTENRAIVFDSYCSLPIEMSSGVIRVSGKVRLVINYEDGKALIGSTPYVVENDTPRFVDHEVFTALVRNTVTEMVAIRKRLIDLRAQ